MKERLFFSAAGLILGFAHLMFVIWVYNQHYEGGWDSFPIAVLDFPVTLILAAVNRFFQLSSTFWWFSYLLLGTVLWYFFGVSLTMFKKRTKRN